MGFAFLTLMCWCPGTFSGLDTRAASVGLQHLSDDRARVRPGEVGDDSRDLLGPWDSPDRDAPFVPLADLGQVDADVDGKAGPVA
jgi:hypothetical protein